MGLGRGALEEGLGSMFEGGSVPDLKTDVGRH
jgi:hypothetical protein